MAKSKKKPTLTRKELEQQDGQELPDREVMSIVPIPDMSGPSMLPPIVPAVEDDEAPE